MILPSERQVILELSHVILDHTHHGMRVYPTAMAATLILQHSVGQERSENSPVTHKVDRGRADQGLYLFYGKCSVLADRDLVSMQYPS